LSQISKKSTNKSETFSVDQGETLWVQAMPGLFVLLWSTGFIGSKMGLTYAEPLTFLLIRFACVLAILIPVVIILRAPWPQNPLTYVHISVVGILVHTSYLAGVYFAISAGMSAGLCALIVGLQPLVTAAFAKPILGEHTSLKQWCGIILGLLGVSLVLGEKLNSGGQTGQIFTDFPLSALVASLLALIGITFGTIYQKRFCAEGDLRTGAVIQFAAAGLILVPIAPFVETMTVIWSYELLFSMAWLVLVLSLGAITLLMQLIRRGAAAKVASLFYLVPPVTALIAYFLFGEKFGLLAIVGMVVTVFGVSLVVRQK